MMLDARRSALVLVDYQQRLMPSIHDAETAIRHAMFLAETARRIGIPVLGTEENPPGLGPNDERVRSLCGRTLAKMSFDACADGLIDVIRAQDGTIDQVVVAGCEAHVCLLQTALGLHRAGLAVFVVPDACGSRRPDDKALAMRRLAQQGAVLTSSEMVAFEWLRGCSHPQFKTVLQLVKRLQP